VPHGILATARNTVDQHHQLVALVGLVDPAGDRYAAHVPVESRKQKVESSVAVVMLRAGARTLNGRNKKKWWHSL
jgi:hypothetical protein